MFTYYARSKVNFIYKGQEGEPGQGAEMFSNRKRWEGFKRPVQTSGGSNLLLWEEKKHGRKRKVTYFYTTIWTLGSTLGGLQLLYIKTGKTTVK